MASLLLGCGNARAKKLYLTDQKEWSGELTTLDMNPDCGADVVWDLERRPLPFADEAFDEIAAYDVLEHIGRQGDWMGWFDEMDEYWRILKPGGMFGAVLPINTDALVDPGHTRFFHPMWFYFLNKKFYEDALGKNLQVTDYRWYIKNWWEVVDVVYMENHHFGVILKKV